MPFKTKSQKRKAAQKRYVFSQEPISLSRNEEKKEAGEARKSADKIPSERDFMRKDLLKILFLSLAVVFAQIGLRLTLF